MTVKELVDALEGFPNDMRVLVDGYEGGMDDISPPRLARAHIGCYSGDYMGDHAECDDRTGTAPANCWRCDDDLAEKKTPVIDVIYIGRK